MSNIETLTEHEKVFDALTARTTGYKLLIMPLKAQIMRHMNMIVEAHRLAWKLRQKFLKSF